MKLRNDDTGQFEPTEKELEKQEQHAQEKQKIIELEAQLAAAKEENLTIMEATAQVYEESQQVKNQLLDNMEATAFLYEELQALKGGTV